MKDLMENPAMRIVTSVLFLGALVLFTAPQASAIEREELDRLKEQLEQLKDEDPEMADAVREELREAVVSGEIGLSERDNEGERAEGNYDRGDNMPDLDTEEGRTSALEEMDSNLEELTKMGIDGKELGDIREAIVRGENPEKIHEMFEQSVDPELRDSFNRGEFTPEQSRDMERVLRDIDGGKIERDQFEKAMREYGDRELEHLSGSEREELEVAMRERFEREMEFMREFEGREEMEREMRELMEREGMDREGMEREMREMMERDMREHMEREGFDREEMEREMREHMEREFERGDFEREMFERGDFDREQFEREWEQYNDNPPPGNESPPPQE